jgi:hypothetical protein
MTIVESLNIVPIKNKPTLFRYTMLTPLESIRTTAHDFGLDWINCHSVQFSRKTDTLCPIDRIVMAKVARASVSPKHIFAQ